MPAAITRYFFPKRPSWRSRRSSVMLAESITDFCPAFKWVAENDITPVCFIYITDQCCYSFPEAPKYPVLWVTDSRRTGPFGETLRISLE
jgi:hypothetical protein